MQLVQSSRAQALSVERGVCDHGSYVFWERTISVFLKENRALGEDWGPVIGAERIRRFQVFSLGGPIKSREIAAMIGFLGEQKRKIIGKSANTVIFRSEF